MSGRHYHAPEHHASAALPVSILLLTVLGISGYLLIVGSLNNGERVGSKVYLPVAQTGTLKKDQQPFGRPGPASSRSSAPQLTSCPACGKVTRQSVRKARRRRGTPNVLKG